MRLLLVEDDELIGKGLQTGLSRAGFAVDLFATAQLASRALAAESYAALLLDLGLPDADGLNLLASLRERDRSLAVIIITARDSLSARLAGLDSGADDYLVKPFAIEELIARIRAVTRRLAVPAHMELQVGPLRMDPARHLLWLRGEPVEVSAMDFALIEVLLRHPGVPLSREQLEKQLYSWSQGIGSNVVEVRIHHLRKRLGAEVIQNVRGVGYRIRESA